MDTELQDLTHGERSTLAYSLGTSIRVLRAHAQEAGEMGRLDIERTIAGIQALRERIVAARAVNIEVPG